MNFDFIFYIVLLKTTHMFKKLLLGCMVLCSLAACKSKTAFNYSEDFVKKERSLLPDINATENSIKEFMEKEQYDSIAIVAGKMEDIVDAKLKEIKDQPAPDVKEGENFKEAGIKYFQYIKSMYTGYKNYGSAKTAVDRETEMNKLVELVDKKGAAIEDMQKMQKKYADANGFKIENK